MRDLLPGGASFNMRDFLPGGANFIIRICFSGRTWNEEFMANNAFLKLLQLTYLLTYLFIQLNSPRYEHLHQRCRLASGTHINMDIVKSITKAKILFIKILFIFHHSFFSQHITSGLVQYKAVMSSQP